MQIAAPPDASVSAPTVVSDVAAPRNPRPATKKVVGRTALYAALIVFSVLMLIPFFWMVMSSLKADNDVFSVPIKWLPETFQWHNYLDIWADADMTTWLRNSLLLSVIITIVQIFTGSLAAYGFARVRFPGRDALFLGYVATIAVPWQAYMIPQFIMLGKLKLTDTLVSLVLLHAFSAFGVFLMKQFYETIPEDLSEAARVDGLSEFGIYRRIMLPLSVPAIASLGLLTFVNTWNDYLGPRIYLRDPDLFTIQLGLRTFQGDPTHAAQFALLFTGSVLSVLPIAIIFLLGQRYFVEGIATSGMKG